MFSLKIYFWLMAHYVGSSNHYIVNTLLRALVPSTDNVFGYLIFIITFRHIIQFAETEGNSK